MRKRFISAVSELSKLQLWIEQFFKENGLKATFHIQLVAEEAFINIIKHGYGEKKEPIDVELALRDGFFILTFIDYCPLFNPNIYQKKDIEGGFGIILIRKFVDDIIYERKGDTNMLILKKRIIH